MKSKQFAKFNIWIPSITSMSLKKRSRNMLIISVSVMVTVAMLAIWFSPVVNNSNQIQLAPQPTVSMTPYIGPQNSNEAHTSHSIVQSKNGPIVNIWVNYSVANNGFNLSPNVTDVSSIGFAQANVSGSNLSLFISFNPSMTQQTESSNASLSNVSGSDPIFTFSKNGPGWGAELGVAQFSASSFSSATVFASAMGVDLGDLITIVTGANLGAAALFGLEFAAVVAGALAIDFIALYAIAQLDHEPSFYVEFGMSWSTGWLGLFTYPGNNGVYGEEGVYSGNADTTDGTYLPFLAVGGNGLSIPFAEFPHVGPWNTFEEPPW